MCGSRPSGKWAAKIANHYAEALLEHFSEDMRLESDETLIYLKSQMEEAENSLREAGQKFRKFQNDNEYYFVT